MTSQEKLKQIRLNHYTNLKKVVDATKLGGRGRYMYGSLAIKEEVEARAKMKVPEYHPDFMPDFTQYQYDLELHIFFNYERLYKRELELCSDHKALGLLLECGPELGCTFFKREKHLANAIKIRWPERKMPDGSVSTAYALTPWAEDYLYGLANYQNLVVFGGAGQGKTHSSIAFQSMLFDHFIYTKSGAACYCSTVSQKKLETSIWSHMNKIYSYKNSYKFSLYAGMANPAGDYMFVRKDIRGKKRIEEGGSFKGILLAQGRTDSSQVDKLTGQHDVIARSYLLDEAQVTDSAPMAAYNNMFLHPPYKWFMMAGNYEDDDDLLAVNVEPRTGWESVDASTHMWESTLKAQDFDLGQKSLVIHYNNDLSPAIVGEHAKDIEKKYGRFMPTEAKKRASYPKLDGEGNGEWKQRVEALYNYRRFWIGFKFKKKDESQQPIINTEILKDFKAWEDQTVRTEFKLASVDTAPGDMDRDVLSIFNVGVDSDGYMQIAPGRVYSIPKPRSQLNYYRETAEKMYEILSREGVQSGHAIIDWTQRTQLLEAMKDNYDFVFHHIIYQTSCPKEIAKNPVTKILERPIELETVPTFQGEFEKEVKTFAHERFNNRITLAAYLFRLFVEHGRWRGINHSIFDGINGNKGFEKEMCYRYFKVLDNRNSNGKITVDSKDVFKAKFKFSPDVLDTFFQVSYLLYVIFEIKPRERGLGLLKKEQTKKVVDNSIWSSRMKFRGRK